MTAVFPTILAVLLGLSFEEFYAETAMPEGSFLKFLLAVPICLVPIGVAELLFWLVRRRFEMHRPLNAQPYARWVAMLPLPLYVTILFGCGWPRIIVPLGVEGTVLIDHVVVLAPYFVLLAAAQLEVARLRRPFRVTPTGPEPIPVREARGALVDIGRQLSLVLVPLLAMIVLLDLVSDTGLRLYFHHLPLLSVALLGVVLASIAIFYPLLFRVGMGLKPLVKGAPLRRRLEEMAANLDFECRDILYWPTRRPVLNAAIVGVLPRFRYVILTEELCKRLTLDEICSVFAHEVGHGKRNHPVFYVLFSFAYLALLVPLGEFVGGLVVEGTEGVLAADLGALALVYLPGFALYWVVVFGALSRRFELEADVYGVDATGDPGLFILTLEKVARLGRIDRKNRAPRHFSIAGRTDFLRRTYLEQQVGELARFREKISWLRKGIIAFATSVFLVASAFLLMETARGAGLINLEHDRDETARQALRTVVALRPDDVQARTLLGEVELYFSTPPPLDGGAHWRRVLDLEPEFSWPERVLILDHLRAGWGRAITRGRLVEAKTLVRRGRVVNRRSGGEVFDASFEEALDGMLHVTTALQERDPIRLRSVVDDAPRWLRRPDLRRTLEFLEGLEIETDRL